VGGERSTAALPDQVDERFSDDGEHLHHPLGRRVLRGPDSAPRRRPIAPGTGARSSGSRFRRLPGLPNLSALHLRSGHGELRRTNETRGYSHHTRPPPPGSKSSGRSRVYEGSMSDQDRPLFLVVTIKPRLDRLAEAEAQLQSMRRSSLTEPGCIFMHLVQPQDDPDTWVMLEMFRSRAAWDEHMRQPYNTEGNVILQDLLREPSDLRLFDEK
jgi:quinol monooxygenase YgiN